MRKKSERGVHSNIPTRIIIILTLLLIAAIAFGGSAAAQEGGEVTPEPTVEVTDVVVPVQQAAVTGVEINGLAIPLGKPVPLLKDTSSILTVRGTGFVAGDAGTKIILLGRGTPLPTSVESDTLMRAALPTDLTVGTYIIEVRDGTGALAVNGSLMLQVTEPTPTMQPPTAAPVPTSAPPPTPIPGAPSLVIRSFNANPATIAPGGTVTFSLEIVNQGTRTAEGVAMSVDSGGKFVPANGQAAILLPSLPVGGSTVAGLAVVSAEDTPAGAQSVPITITYRDFSGESYSSKGSLTVTVQQVQRSSQVTLARYLVDPNPVQPGKGVKLAVLVTNTGNEMASQVLLRVSGEGGVLLAGPQGDSFPVGDLAPGASASVEMPLIVSASAKAGPQPQTISINYLQDGEAKSVNSSITLDVAQLVVTAPVLVLESYDIGKDILQPGEPFTMKLTLKNVGEDDATNMLVTFGTVDSSGATGGDSSTGTGSTGTGSTGSTTSTTPSSTFAPLGSGGAAFVGTVEGGGGTVALTQDFIVNGSVLSGIYSLPITLRYQKPDGASAQDSLRASLVVVVPPTLRFNLQGPLPETANVGEMVMLALDITNQGKNPVTFTTAVATAENAEIIEGAETFLGPLRVDEDTSLNVGAMPSAEGPVKITLTFNYIDELNKPQTLVETYEFQAVAPPPPPEDMGSLPGEFLPMPTEEPKDDGLLGRLLLGLLGLGS